VHILITGAASGIGKELIHCFAREKEAILSLVDINEQGLKNIVTRLEVPAYAYTLDLANLDAVPSAIRQIEQDHGPIDVLINCAGIMFIQSIAGTPWEKGLQLLNIDLISPLRIVNLVLPAMIERRKGHIVNVSSMAGVTTIPGCCYYGAAKSGLGLASEILRGEVKRYGIGVTTVYLGPIKTPLEAQCRNEVKGNIYSDNIPTGSPQRTAELIYQAVKKNRALVIYTWAYWFVRRIQRIANWFVLRLGPDPKI
jgi:short-subunit dehydrogenase